MGGDNHGAGGDEPTAYVAETVELSVVLPIEASPAIRPPLPAVLEASFSSVPVAETSSVPAEIVIVLAPRWPGGDTRGGGGHVGPIASRPPTATPVALALWRLEFTALIVASVPRPRSASRRSLAVTGAESVMLPGVVDVDGVMLTIVAPSGCWLRRRLPDDQPSRAGNTRDLRRTVRQRTGKQKPASRSPLPVVADTLPLLAAVLTGGVGAREHSAEPAVAEDCAVGSVLESCDRSA